MRKPIVHHPPQPCIKCLHVLPASKFWLQTNGKPTNVCKGCAAKKSKEWASKNRVKTRSYGARWREKNPSATHRHKLMYRYGMTLEDFNNLLGKQNGGCAICGKPEAVMPHLCVDHCHKSGKNRGLLCDKCNRGIGCFSDSAARLLAAAKYLESFGQL